MGQKLQSERQGDTREEMKERRRERTQSERRQGTGEQMGEKGEEKAG